MTARQVLNAKAGQKVGLGNGLRLVCDKRNDGRYFELRKRVRGKDYSWGVGNVETLTIAGCNKALSSARQQAEKILEALASGADPAGIGKSANLGSSDRSLASAVSALSQQGSGVVERGISKPLAQQPRDSLQWLMDSPIAASLWIT